MKLKERKQWGYMNPPKLDSELEELLDEQTNEQLALLESTVNGEPPQNLKYIDLLDTYHDR